MSNVVKNNLRAILGIVLSVGLLWWVLREVSIRTVWQELAHANWWLLILGTICSTLIFPLRARRWQTILDPIYPKLPLGALWRSTALGMMINNVVPARAGEVARAYALTKETPVVFSASVASLAVDRVFDAIVLLLLAFLAVLSPSFPQGGRVMGQSVTEWAIGGTILVSCLIAVLYSLVFFPAQLIRLFELFARRLSPTIENKGKAVLATFSQGLSVLRSPGHFVAVFFWTVAHWLLNAFAWWLGMVAFGISVPFSAPLLLQALVALGVAVPAAPGYFGIYEKVAIIGLAIYVVPKELATSWAIGFHILTFIPITLIGAFYFSRLGLKLREIQEQPQSAS